MDPVLPPPAPLRYISPRGESTPSAGANKPAAESESTVSYLLTVVKGPCKNMKLEMACQSASAAGSMKRSKCSAETVKSVGRDEDCDFSLSKDKYLSGRYAILLLHSASSRHLFLQVLSRRIH
jgi:hypothetical protein